MVDWTLEHTPLTEEAKRKSEEEFARTGIRAWLMGAYEMGRYFYSNGINPRGRKTRSPVRWANEFGVMLWYGLEHCSRRKRTMIDVDALAAKWHTLIVGLAMAHDKDEADRFEAAVDECLTPLVKAPVKQLREFAAKVRDSLKADPKVPYLVWRAMESWIDKIVLPAPDDGIKELKTQLAAEIVEMVEDDAKRDLPAAMVRALQWRSPEKLEEVKRVVAEEKQAGRGVRLRGRESCLFLECGGTLEEPRVCVQV